MTDAADLREVLDQVEGIMATDPRDWSSSRRDAILYGIFCGWGCEEDHVCDWICGGQNAMKDVAKQWGWTDDAVARLRRYRAAIVKAMAEPQSPPPSPEREEKETPRG